MLEDKVCSAIVLIARAKKCIEEGQCDQALICGLDVYDSERTTIGCLFLQREHDCKRAYAKPVEMHVNKPLRMVGKQPGVVETSEKKTVMSGVDAVLKMLVEIQSGRLVASKGEYWSGMMAVNVLWDSCEYVHLILEPCLDKKGNLMTKEA